MTFKMACAFAGAMAAFALGLGAERSDAAQTATIDGISVVNRGAVNSTAPLSAQPAATGDFVGQIEVGSQGTLWSNPGWSPYGPDDLAHEWWNINAGDATFGISGTTMSFIWGSPNYDDPDLTNTLTFYNGTTIVGTVRAYDLYRAFSGIDNGNHGGYFLTFAAPAFTSVVAKTPAAASNFEFAFAESVPEPATWALMALGFGGLVAFGLRRKRSPVAMNL